MTKEKRLIATNKTEEERDRLTEVWKKRIVSEKGYSETIAERIAEKSEITGRLHAIWLCHHRILQTER